MWFILILILFAALCFYLAYRSQKSNKAFLEKNEITISKKSPRFLDGKTIIYDEKKNTLLVFRSMLDHYIFPAEKIIGCELKIDDETNFSTSIKSSAGRAIVGGTLFGVAGAVVGGVTGKKQGSTIIKKIELIISSSDLNKPFVRILVLNDKKGVKKDSAIFETNYNNAMYWCKFIEALIKLNEKEAPLN